MRRLAHSASIAASSRLRRLDQRLHIDHGGTSEWIWAVPALTVVATFAIIVAVGVGSGVGAAMFVPVAMLVAVVMGGMSVAYMTPEAHADADGGGGRDRGARPGDMPPCGPAVPSWYQRMDVETVKEPDVATERNEELATGR